jgi:hypothetical protein
MRWHTKVRKWMRWSTKVRKCICAQVLNCANGLFFALPYQACHLRSCTKVCNIYLLSNLVEYLSFCGHVVLVEEPLAVTNILVVNLKPRPKTITLLFH